MGGASDFVTLVMIALLERVSETEDPSVTTLDAVIWMRIGLKKKASKPRPSWLPCGVFLL